MPTGSLFPDDKRTDPRAARPGRARKGRVFLIDGTALAYRSHFALISSPLLTSKGQNVSGLFLFAQTLFRLIEKEHPDFIACGFDLPGKTFRHERYAEYKATRDKTPDELIALFPAIKQLVQAFQIPVLELPGYEADDVIATVARQAEAAGHEVFIVTGDKDFLQIVSERVQLYNILRPDKDVEIQGPDAARAKFGVGPEHVIDVLALMGDASDNVPGVSGIGPKTATELITRFGSVKRLYEQLDQVERAAVRAKLEKDRELAFLSLELVTFDLAAPVRFDEERFKASRPDPAALAPLFRSYEMDSLMKRVSVDQAHDEHTYHVIRDTAAYATFLERLRGATEFALDTETTGLDPLRARLVGISVSFTPREAWYLPVNLDPPLFSPERDIDRIARDLAPILADPNRKKRGQNAKYDLLVLRRHGMPVLGIDFDTMLASYCVSPGELQHNLDHLALKYLNFQKVKTSELIGTGAKQITMDQVDVDKVGNYACEDVDVVNRLLPILGEELRNGQLEPLFRDIEMPLLSVLADVEEHGVALDLPLLRHLSDDFDQRLKALTEEIHAIAQEPFNINSPIQLGKILFEKLEVQKAPGVKKPKRTKTGWSTDAAVLEGLKVHPLPAKILEYRALQKLKSTYIDALPALVHPETGRVHTSFNQAVAATGRLSSSDPNLQNIPIRSEEGQKIRRAFVPGIDDGVLLSADYSQVELRLLAHLSKDENLVRAFREGADVHRWTAGLIFGMKPQDVPPELRARAKTINFGVIYGMGAQRLATETDMSVAEAAKFIEAYFTTFSGVKAYLDGTLESARKLGYVTTLLGRRRYIAELDSEHPRVAAAARNVAINTPIQGTAADLIKIAMIRIHRELAASRTSARMILQVHDELVFELKASDVEPVTKLVRQTMEHALTLDVPLVVDIGVGKNWLEAH
jgi:DNA polymerase-1